METNKEFIKDRVISGLISESSGDYALPDYNGDVKKILFTSARAVPSGKFPSTDTVQFSGAVEYSIVYLDGENNITHCEFTTDYDIAVKCSEESYRDADIDTAVENTSIRLSGPRKFTTKAVLSSNVHLLEADEIGVEGDAFIGREPEVLMKDIKIRCTAVSESEEREYAEELEHLDGVIADEAEVLIADAKVKTLSAAAEGSRGEHKGEIVITALVKCEGEVPHRVEKSIPFEDSFIFEGDNSLEGLEVEDVIPELTVTSLKCNVSPDADGVTVAVSVITEGKMKVVGNTEVSIVKDCYLTDSGCDNDEDVYDYCELIGCEHERVKLSESVPRSSVSCEGVRNFLFTDAVARTDEVKLEGGAVSLCGEVRFSGIACEICEDGTPVYSNVKLSVPFSENVNVSCQIPEGARAEYTLCASASDITLDAANLIAECALDISVSIVKDRRESYVCASNRNETEYIDDDTLVCVYYPDEGETLFDIAKKYHKSQLTIAGINSLTESVFADKTSPISSLGVNKLIIR